MSPRIAIVGGGGGVGSSPAFNLLLRPEPYDVALVDGPLGHGALARDGPPAGDRRRRHRLGADRRPAGGGRGRRGRRQRQRAADRQPLAHGLPARQRRDPARRQRGAGRRLARRRDRRHQPRRPAVHLAHVHRRRSTAGASSATPPTTACALRTAVGEALGVRSAAVDAWVLGEHGDGCVPLLDRVRVGGEPVALAPAQRGAGGGLRARLVRAPRRAGLRALLDLDDRPRRRADGRRADAATARSRGPPRCVLDGEYGVDGVALSVPVDARPRRRARSTSGSCARTSGGAAGGRGRRARGGRRARRA